MTESVMAINGAEAIVKTSTVCWRASMMSEAGPPDIFMKPTTTQPMAQVMAMMITAMIKMLRTYGLE